MKANIQSANSAGAQQFSDSQSSSMATMLPDSTWFKLFVAIVSMAAGLFLFKLFFAWKDSPFLTPFYSFLVLVIISMAIYWFAMFAIRKLTGRAANTSVIP